MATRLSAWVLVLVAALLLSSSLFTVAQGQRALRTRLGMVQGEYGPGLHAKWPLDRVYRFDLRVATHGFPAESFASADQKLLSVDFSLQWRVRDLRRYYALSEGDDERAMARLADLVRARIQAAFAAAPLQRVLASPRAGLSDSEFEQARVAAAALGVDLLDVQLGRVDLTDELANGIYQRMEQNLIADTQRLRTDGMLEAAKIRADADRKRAAVTADATRQSQHLRGEADARAAQAYARVYERNPDFAAFYRSMQAYKNTLGRDSDILVIGPEGEFFKYLHSASGH
jgi:membrane protease subunit HflC